jgi:hypothetical protein
MSYSADYAKDLESQLATAHRRIAELESELEAASLRSIEASNPGIDMDEVRRIGGYRLNPKESDE